MQGPDFIMTRASKGNSIAAGLDFGTTFSGVAFAFTGKPPPLESMPIIKNWRAGKNCEKVPTELRYEDCVEVASTKGKLKKRSRRGVQTLSNSTGSKVSEWGYEVNKNREYIRLIKTLLQGPENFPDYIDLQTLLSQLRRHGKTPIDVVADYLRKIKEQIDAELTKKFGHAMVANTPIDIVLTVPAVWTDAAKDATRKAAEQAGLSESSNLHMITEPEAAALCVLRQMENVNLKLNDSWIVCDAGGGTVDLITYQVCSLAPLSFREVVPGDGGLCGSTFLNLRFEEHVEAKMGAPAFDRYRQENALAWGQCLNHFEERTKRDFEPFEYPNKEYHIPFFGAEDNEAAGIESNLLVLTVPDLKEIFRPIMNGIFNLVDGQLRYLEDEEVSPRGIILVGGFGESAYLFESLKRRYANSNTGFCILQPPNAWTAIARGAVISRLEGKSLVESRVARRHYGVMMRQSFDEDKHSTDQRIWDSDSEEYYVPDQIRWYVKKGQTLPENHSIKMDFYCNGPPGGASNTEMTIVISRNKDAPTEFECTRQTKILCELDVSLERIPQRRWLKNYTDSGRRYTALDYTVAMRFGPGQITFELVSGSELVGSLIADYAR